MFFSKSSHLPLISLFWKHLQLYKQNLRWNVSLRDAVHDKVLGGTYIWITNNVQVKGKNLLDGFNIKTVFVS